MAAEGSGWITTVVCRGRMTLAFSLLVLFLVGLPHEGDSTIPIVKPKSPSAEECRQHVEKAVDQYFGAKSGDQTTSQDDTSTHIQTPPTEKTSDDDEDGKNPPITIVDKNQTDDDDEDENGSKDDDEDDKKNQDDQVKQNRSDDDKELRKKHTDDEIKKDSDKIIDDSDDDDDDDDDEDDEDEDDVGIDQTVKIDANLVDDNDEDDDDEDEDEMNDDNEDLHDNADDNDADDENDRDDDVVTKDNITKPSEYRTIDNVSNHHREARSTKVESGDDDDDDEKKDDSEEDDDDEEETNNEEDDDDDEEETNNEEEEDDDADKESDDEENGDDEDEEEEKKPTNIPKIQIIRSIIPEKIDQKEKDSEKVTGGPNLTTARMAQELPGGKPQTEQPKTQEVPKEAQAVIKPQAEGTNQTPLANKTIPATTENEDDDEEDEDDDDDDLIENIYEEDDDDDDDDAAGLSFRSRVHVDAILNLDSIGAGYDQEEDRLALPIYKDIKKIHAASIKPMEVLYKYTDSTSRLLGDAEIFNKPMILFLGPWNTGKTAIINFLLGIERTPAALKTGTGITDVDFTVITHGDKRQTISGTELAVDWKYASLQRFGQRFLDHFKAVTVPHTLLKKINIIDTPGILENRKNLERGYPFNDAFQWFIDRADAIYVVLDPTKIDVGAELGTVVDQLKGREVHFILNKADTIRRSDLMKVVGQLFWNLSPLMGSSEAPVIYAVSLSSKPFNPTAPAKFLADQENNFLFDLRDTMDKRVENRILYARRHAVRVRNHAKMVDCYLATYYRHKSIFSNKKNVAKEIIENPKDYHIYEGLGNLSNVSRYDIPDTSTYTNFFRLHPLYDFRPLASTCSYFRGCPMDKLDAAVSVELPELLARYKKAKNASPSQVKQEGR